MRRGRPHRDFIETLEQVCEALVEEPSISGRALAVQIGLREQTAHRALRLLRGLVERFPKAEESAHDPADGLPPDLARVLRDPAVRIPRDHEITLADGRTLFDHLEEWRNAPSNTASAG